MALVCDLEIDENVAFREPEVPVYLSYMKAGRREKLYLQCL